ncbi:MAG TPA: tRNA (adenosine(37)-N6)-dimethylallyltransferase MiaA [Gemmatimonadaceae bacterium]|nr:tRNA (adenosine(37)-N6)-dimethylallyltransferase MiaA [Gemmatimonadaceae bacterium]
MGDADATSGSAPPRPISVICGPTAAGKSVLALALAEREGLAIVSADSRQVYRGFDVGTAKPTAAERARVPHFGIDVVDPTSRYSAARWASDAEGWIAEAVAAGREPIVVGGTGLYLRALFSPLHDAPALDEERRRTLESELARLSTADLRRWCEQLDPARAHLGRTQLLRSVETALLTGRRLGDVHREAARAARYAARYLVVSPEPAVLAGRIERRVGAMLDAGWVDEVRELEQRLPPDAPAWTASGYGTVRRLAAGEITRDEAARAIMIETRQYAKRQRTWFRHQLGGGGAVTQVDPDDARAADVVAAWWSEGGRTRSDA